MKTYFINELLTYPYLTSESQLTFQVSGSPEKGSKTLAGINEEVSYLPTNQPPPLLHFLASKEKQEKLSLR